MKYKSALHVATIMSCLAWAAAAALAQEQEFDATGEQPSAGLSAEMRRLRDDIRGTLAHYQARPLNTRDHNCWELMHSIVAYGIQSRVLLGGTSGEPVNAIGWLCYGNPVGGQKLVSVERGRLSVAKGPRVQGHHGQFLAIVAQSRVRTDYPIEIGGESFTLADLIESEKLGCQAGTELTFKLIALAHYLDSDSTWRNSAGESWSISRLIQEEIKSPIIGAACGGTHRLMGLSYAVNERLKQGGALDGQFMRADRYVRDYHRYTFSLQNSDGSFSTDWFKSQAAKPDVERRLQTTGHILEWMSYSVPAETLDDPRLVKAVVYLTRLLATDPERTWAIGPLGHGLHALAVYYDRQFNETGAGGAERLARRNGTQRPDAKRPSSKGGTAAKRSTNRRGAKTSRPIDEHDPTSSEPPAELTQTDIEPAKLLDEPAKLLDALQGGSVETETERKSSDHPD
jgi:hypothetical protein